MKLHLLLFITLTTMSLTAQDTESNLNPYFKIDGALKNKYEYATETNMSRFSVRNSRVGVRGDVNEFSSYRVQVELSDEGEFNVLDLSGTFKPIDGLSLTFGQTGIPLFNSYIVTPAEMMFANRAFLGKYYLSTRDLGINAKYDTYLGSVPARLEMGLYNGNTINNPVWKRDLSFGGRLEIGDMEGLRFTSKIYNYPNNDSTHFLIYGADLRYEINNFKVETELMKKESKTEFHNDLISYYVQSAYRIPVNNEMFDYILPAARWDAIDGNSEEDGFDVNRLTVGLGFGYTGLKFSSILRFDYEWYIINNDMAIFNKNEEMDSNKITMELLITF